MLTEHIERGRIYDRAGNWDRALLQYEEAFSRVGREGTVIQAVDLLRWMGTVHLRRGALELSEEMYEASLAIARINDLGVHEAKALNCLGGLAHVRGDVGLAEERYGEARARAEELADQREAAMLETSLGALANLRGDMVEALDRYTKALERYQILGDESNAARALNELGMTYLDLGDREQAASHFSKSADLAQAAGDWLLTGIVELNRVEMCVANDEPHLAAEPSGHPVATFSHLGEKAGIGESFMRRGILHRDAGDADKANAHFALALGLAEAGQDRLLQAETQVEWALLLLRNGRNQEGIRYLNRALGLFEELQAKRELVDGRNRLDRMGDLYRSAIERWSATLFRDERAVLEHSRRVADLAERMGRSAGFSGWDLSIVRVGALVHDVGKTLIPARTAEDYRRVGSGGKSNLLHTLAGHAFTRQLGFPAEVQAIVRHHHEEMAGTGAPDGLAGDRIPLAARIVAVADAFDTLTWGSSLSERICSPAEALQLLEAEAGRVFDPGVLALLPIRDVPRRTAVVAA